MDKIFCFLVVVKEKFGPGRLDVGELVKLWLVGSVIGVKRHVGSDGKPFRRLIVGVAVIVIAGRLIVGFFRQISISVLGKGGAISPY